MEFSCCHSYGTLARFEFELTSTENECKLRTKYQFQVQVSLVDELCSAECTDSTRWTSENDLDASSRSISRSSYVVHVEICMLVVYSVQYLPHYQPPGIILQTSTTAGDSDPKLVPIRNSGYLLPSPSPLGALASSSILLLPVPSMEAPQGTSFR